MSEFDQIIIRDPPPAQIDVADRNVYLRSDSAVDVVKKSLGIYVRHFPVLFLTLFLVALPFDVMTVAGLEENVAPWVKIGQVLAQFALVFGGSALSITASDICRGVK